MAMSSDGDACEPLEILRIWSNDDVHILSSSEDSPGVYRKAAHENKLDACLGEAAEKLVEGRLGQLR